MLFRSPIQLPARSPNLNAYAERWVRSVKEECLSKLVLFGEASLRRALADFIDHYHAERNHQGKGNTLLFPPEKTGQHRPRSRVRCRERLGGLLSITAMLHEFFDQKGLITRRISARAATTSGIVQRLQVVTTVSMVASSSGMDSADPSISLEGMDRDF